MNLVISIPDETLERCKQKIVSKSEFYLEADIIEVNQLGAPIYTQRGYITEIDGSENDSQKAMKLFIALTDHSFKEQIEKGLSIEDEL